MPSIQLRLADDRVGDSAGRQARLSTRKHADPTHFHSGTRSPRQRVWAYVNGTTTSSHGGGSSSAHANAHAESALWGCWVSDRPPKSRRPISTLSTEMPTRTTTVSQVARWVPGPPVVTKGSAHAATSTSPDVRLQARRSGPELSPRTGSGAGARALRHRGHYPTADGRRACPGRAAAPPDGRGG